MGDVETRRVLAVDPGDKRIGIAIADPTGTIARPLTVIEHTSRERDVREILAIAEANAVTRIVVGVPLHLRSEPPPQARKALRLAEALGAEGDLPVDLWDESGSTAAATRDRQKDSLTDARAAAFILQEYLDAQAS